METHETGQNGPTPRPSRDEAGALLQDADRISAAMQNAPVPVPRWYYPALAAALAGIALAQMLPAIPAVIVTVLVAAGMGATFAAGVQHARYMPRVNWRATLPAMIIIVLFWVAAIVLHRTYDMAWVWIVVAGVNGLFMLALGAWHRRLLKRAAT